MRYLKPGTRGDTIIEVMLAMALLTAFLFISWGITNKATQIGINARKRVEMINAMKEQAEAIKAVYAKGGVEQLIASINPTNDITIETQSCQAAASVSEDNIFYYVNSAENQLERVIKQKKQQPDANSTLWTQYKEGPVSGPEPDAPPQYYDFYIRTCWQTIGSAQTTDNAQFIVRLNHNSPGSAPTTPTNPDPTPAITTGDTYLVYEDILSSSVGFDRDYNDMVASMNVVESYDENNYLDKITLQFKHINNGADAPNHLYLDFDGVFRLPALHPSYTSVQNFNSMGMFAGSSATIRKAVHTAGSTPSSFQPVANGKAQDLLLFGNQTNRLGVNQVVTVEITNIEKRPENLRSNRDEFNPKRYRVVLRVDPLPVVGLMGWDIDLADINPSMFDTSRYPVAFFVPTTFAIPSPGQSINSIYCNFSSHATWLWNHRNDDPIPYETEPEQAREWYNYKVVSTSPYECRKL